MTTFKVISKELNAFGDLMVTIEVNGVEDTLIYPDGSAPDEAEQQKDLQKLAEEITLSGISNGVNDGK